MKVSISLLAVLCAIYSSYGQEREKHFYVGINLGTSLLLNGNDSRGTIGANLNLINAGYSFKNNFGINLKWMGASHVISENNKVGYGALLIGPMYSIPVGNRNYLDIKLRTGLFWITEKASYSTTTSPDDPIITINQFNRSEASLSFSNLSAGLTLRHNFTNYWSLLILTEYNSGKHSGFSFYIDGKRLQAININAGIALRI